MALSGDETKAALKEAIKEWLDEQAASFGWWTARFFASAALAAMIYFILIYHGWRRG